MRPNPRIQRVPMRYFSTGYHCRYQRNHRRNLRLPPGSSSGAAGLLWSCQLPSPRRFRLGATLERLALVSQWARHLGPASNLQQAQPPVSPQVRAERIALYYHDCIIWFSQFVEFPLSVERRTSTLDEPSTKKLQNWAARFASAD